MSRPVFGVAKSLLRTTNDSLPSNGSAPSGVDENLWNNNPYAGLDYKHTWWQKLLEGLGFRSNYDKYRESMALNAQEYNAQLLEKAHNEEYDSAGAQVARERAAGINPDLAGNVDAGGSSPMEPDPNAPIEPSSDEGSIGSFVNTLFGLFTTAIGLSKDVLSLGQLKNAVDSGNISNAKSILDFGMQTAVSFIPSQYPEGDPDWINRSSDLAYEIASPFMSKRQQKMFRRSISALYGSAPAQSEQWQSWLNSAKGKQSYFGLTSSELFGDGSDEVLRIISDNVAKYSDKIFWQSKKNELRGSENQGEYLEQIDPSLQADVENITNKRNLESGSIDAILNECLNSIVTDLRDRSESNKRGHSMAQVALLVFSLFRMMNFSRTSGIQNGKPVNTTSVGF